MNTLKNTRWVGHLFNVLLLYFVSVTISFAGIKYVKPTGNDNNTGTSWGQAYQTIQKAIEVAVAGDQIWIASGTYYPTKDETGSASPADARTKVFYINKNVAIYGGFNGTESSLIQRNWRTNIVTLSGDVGTVGNASDNAYHVVKIYGVSSSMILDGVQITGGNANASSGTINRLGGGILVHGASSVNSAPAITNCRIYANSAIDGGAVAAYSFINGTSQPSFYNCIITGNSASSSAGGVYNFSDGDQTGVPFSITTFEHCTFYENTASTTAQVGYSRAIDDGGSTLTLRNCIAWGTSDSPFFSAAFASDFKLEGGLYKGGCTSSLICSGSILDTDPLFVDAVGGNFRLTSSSPALDVAGGEFFSNSNALDYDGNPRPVGCVDYGAFEFTTSNATTLTCYRDNDADTYGNPALSKLFCTSCPSGWVQNANDCDDTVPAGGGYSINQSGTFAPISGPGTPLSIGDDQGIAGIPIGFTFQFYGQPYTTVSVASNGVVGFAGSSSSACCSGQLIPNPTSPNNLIAVAWDDLNPSAGGSINYFTTGTAPNRRMVINYTGIPVCCSGSSPDVNTQLILKETSNVIEIHTTSISGVSPATMGVENANGTSAIAVPGRNRSAWSATNDFVSFTPVSISVDILTTFYRDQDGDGFGNFTISTQPTCSVPVGYVVNSTDCDDYDALEKPDQIWYKDTDNDGYAETGAATMTQCERPIGYKVATELTATSGDCNDNNNAIKPGATEVCDGVDNNCNGSIDEGVTPTTWYRDVDGDGFGNLAVTQQACIQPSGYVSNSTDCDDTDAMEKPGQVWYKDTDNDGYAQTGAATMTQCLRPTGYKVATELTATSGDCNDNNNAIKPGATEVCDGVDNNCNGSIDEGVTPTTWYRDVDGDGFGNLAVTQQACIQPSGYVSNSTDCDDTDALEKPGQVWYKDSDNDGYAETGASTMTQCLRPTGYKLVTELTATTGDCNDANAAINPGATEVCDGVDNDCDGSVDEGGLTTYYADADNDGFGNASVSQQACTQPSGYVSNSTDCDDSDAMEKPGQVWYKDSDNDGYAETGASTMTQCLRPTNYKLASELTSTTGDCNDNNVAINPGATEVCDGVDNDCDGSVDEGGLTTYYADADNDGFGNASVSQQACSQPTGYVSNNTDCDDNDAMEKPGQVWYKDSDNDGYAETGASTMTQCLRPTNYKLASELTSTTGDCNDNNAAINPGATEVCDGVDNDCDGSVDEGVTTTYYADADNDGFGNASVSQQACSQPSGYVSNNTDCDDNDAMEKPGQVWYKDSDNDGYAETGASTLTQCLRPLGYKLASELTSTTGDCNDNNAAINPGATEVCDGVDNDCDGSVDEGVTTTYYADADNDGFGNASVSQQACSQPSGYVSNNTDCDDNDAMEKPGQVWYKDIDNDGYAETGASTLTQCLRPLGYKLASELTSTTGDCNDNNAAINPGATEVCDGVDNDCDGSVDEGGLTTYYADADNDGFGNASVSQQACSQPTGYVSNNTDCDDNDPLEKPGQVWYADLDNDGYSSGTTLTQCLRPTNYKLASELTSTMGDCNDNNVAINPGATEVCDGVDNDCDGSVDEGGLTTYYADADNDGFGNASVSQQACSQPTGYVSNNTDCDDNDAMEKPGQVWYKDSDNDGYAETGASTMTQCLRPTNYKLASELTSTTGDCNDNNAAINPGATEVCDGVDNDCDGSVDEGGLTTYYADADNDGFGNALVSQQACSQPTGYVSNNTDCDDNDAMEKPGQVWYADLDNDGYSSGTTLTQCLRPTNYKLASELTSTTGDCNDNNAAIINSLSATVDYSGSPYCKSVTNAAVTLTGNSGGTFSSTSGLTLDGATGAINPSASIAGIYTVTYSIAASGGCAGVNATTVVVIQGKPTITLTTLQQTLNEGNNPVLCDTDANPVNSLQFTVSGSCVVGNPVWRVQVGSGAWSTWSATAPVSQSSNNQPHRYQAACDASCPSTYTSPIELTINYRSTVPQNVSLLVDGVTVAVGESKEVCSLVNMPLTFNTNCAAGEIILYSVDGGEYSSGVPTGLVDNQFHNYRVRCRKSDGTPSCVESESGVMRLKLVTIPSAPTVSLSATSSCDATASFSGQSSCGSLRTVWYNASTNVALPSLPSTVPSQTTSYYARCQTENGCVSEKSNVVTFTLTPTQVAPVITASQEIVCTGTTVTISANCPAGSQTFWNTGVTTPSFEVAFNNVTKQTYWAKCLFEGGCQSSESVRKDIYWNAFVVTLINVGETKSAVKSANDKSLWSSQFITRDGGPELEQSTQVNPTLYYVENTNKTAPRYWTINVEACGLSTDGSLTFDMLATPEMGVIRSFNTHENNAPYFMYANREGWTELYAQNHPAYGFYQDNGAGGNVYDAGLPKGLYKLGIRYWDMKGWGSIYPSTRKPQGNVLAYQEYWFRIQSKDGVGVGAARTAESVQQSAVSSGGYVSDNGQQITDNGAFAEVMPNPVTNVLRLKVQNSKEQVVQTTLSDATGREVLRRQFVPETNTHQEEFGVSELPSGMYFLKVSTSEKQVTLKVVKVE